MPNSLKKKYDKLFQVWFPKDEYDSLVERSRLCGVSMSEYVRSLVKDNIPREAPSGDWVGMMKELKAIGNSMNQIAHVANATGIIDQENYHEQILLLRQNIREIEQTVYNNGND